MCILVYVEVVEELVVRIPLKEFNPNFMLHLFTWDEEEEDKYALKKTWLDAPKISQIVQVTPLEKLGI